MREKQEKAQKNLRKICRLVLAARSFSQPAPHSRAILRDVQRNTYDLPSTAVSVKADPFPVCCCLETMQGKLARTSPVSTLVVTVYTLVCWSLPGVRVQPTRRDDGPHDVLALRRRRRWFGPSPSPSTVVGIGQQGSERAAVANKFRQIVHMVHTRCACVWVVWFE